MTDVCSPSKEEMCSSLYDLRSATPSSSSTSRNCTVSESCTNFSCPLLDVVYKGFSVLLSLETMLLPCSDPYGVHLRVTSPADGVFLDDTFIQSRNLTRSLFNLKADVIVDITQQCYGLTLSVSFCSFHLLLFTITVLLMSLRSGFSLWEMRWSSFHRLTYTCSVPYPQVCPCHYHCYLMVTIAVVLIVTYMCTYVGVHNVLFHLSTNQSVYIHALGFKAPVM